MPIYYNDNMMLASNSESDKEFAKHYKLKTMNFNPNNYSAEENLLMEINSITDLILDDIGWGEHLNQEEFEMIQLAHANILEVYGNVSKRNQPSHLKDD
ncbi:MAG: hypothetical protein MUQ75_00265 [Crocinitomicaceae bacterium]|nr:hypothetical protein [Crocinitomicaceae bacterium]